MASLVACGGDSSSGGGDGGPDGGDSPLPNGIVVQRDEHGIPHISAPTDEGAMFGLGYATAQDRLLHMNLMAYGIQGRLSEVLGRVPVGNSDTVAIDREVRAFGYWRHAQAIVDALPTDTRAMLDAYAAGVNKYMADNPGVSTPLMAGLGVTAETWTPAHTIGVWYWIGRFFTPGPLGESQGLHQFEDEVAQFGLTAALDDKLCGKHPGDPSTGIVQQSDVPQATQDAIAAYAATIGVGTHTCSASSSSGGSTHQVPNFPTFYNHDSPKFSHAWVVGGDHTTTGSAVLVSDPQTPVTFPAIWYEYALTGENISARGIGVPGNPGILIGFNDNLAWGVTAAGFDQSDLFRIEPVGQSRTMYVLDGQNRDMFSETETIVVKGEASQDLIYRETVFGPMVTEFSSDNQGEEFAARYIPFADESTDTIVGFIGMLRAKNFADLNAALDDYRFPPLNMVAGDRDGNTMYRLSGAVPVRSTLSPLGGSIAQEGNVIAGQWQGTIPPALMPQVTNPAGGSIVSGNHRATGAWYPLPLGLGANSAGDTHRSARIRELLAELPAQATPQQVLDEVQFDCAEVGRRDVVLVGAHLSGMGMLSADAESAIAALDTWLAGGGQLSASTPGAFLASKMTTKFRIADTGPVMHAKYGGAANGYTLFAKTMRESLAADPNFVPTPEEIAFVDGLLSQAWQATQGTPVANWTSTYAAQGVTELDHFALLGLPSVGQESSNQVSLECFTGTTVWSQQSQSYTQWVDLSSVDSSLAVMPIGNSEQAAAPSSQSQGAIWAQGSLRPAPLSAAAFSDIAVSVTPLEMDE